LIALRKSQGNLCAQCSEALDESAHLDHIIQLHMGGTHTRDNVRFLCGTCNMTRPRDHSDVGLFQFNLFMQPQAPATNVAANRSTQLTLKFPRKSSRTCLICGLPNVPDGRVWRNDMHCYDCKAKNTGRGGGRPSISYNGKHDMGTVVMLRRCGDGYKRIAKAIGVSRETARALVKRAEQIGLVPA
jgi:hypothetical protein